ncbi:unnamed protein product [Trichogramma brassicae]|uniref:Uncharacterized protein n=1 Tax=Trichogramma brassicae TaxID=86971 RepID=A0A6H5I300_9HYME|nr:unnamed protein product [Trichogramma brassicae]
MSNSNNNKNKCKHFEVLTYSSRSAAELSERYELCVRKLSRGEPLGRVLCTNTYIQDDAETWRKLHCSGAYNSIVHNPLYIDRSLSARLCLSLAPSAVSLRGTAVSRLQRVLGRGIKCRRQIYRAHRRTCHRNNVSVLAQPRMYCTRRSEKEAPRHRQHALTST